MRNLGNRLTLHSPTRGFSMELGSAITVVFATRLELPVSTTQCIIGATVGGMYQLAAYERASILAIL